MEAAKAAAQAHHDARILAALDLTPSPDAASPAPDPDAYRAGLAAAFDAVMKMRRERDDLTDEEMTGVMEVALVLSEMKQRALPLPAPKGGE
jgi:hypothetical protein